MIARVTGRLVEVCEGAALVQDGGVCYELLVPAVALDELRPMVGNSVTFQTIYYIEGNATIGNLVPRLIGFLSGVEREFFGELTRVKGVSARRALRAMALPLPQIASAIERDDQRFLTALPEIGKKTAAQMVTELRGRMERFAVQADRRPVVSPLTEAQRLAVEILVQWGDRPVEAQRWVGLALEQSPSLSEPDQIVRAVYKIRQAGSRNAP